MNAIYAISFFNKEHLQFNLDDYGILKEQWFDKQILNKNFNVFGVDEIPNFLFIVNKQLNYFLEKYENPGPITNPKFEDRKTLLVNGSAVLLNLAVFDHFRIHQLYDIIEELELSMINQNEFYIIPRKNLSNQLHLPIIYRVKHFLNEDGSKLIDLEKRIQNEFATTVSKDFIYEVLADLDALDIIKINYDLVEKAKYFNFFY
jgi:hypothetical protein